MRYLLLVLLLTGCAHTQEAQGVAWGEVVADVLLWAPWEMLAW